MKIKRECKFVLPEIIKLRRHSLSFSESKIKSIRYEDGAAEDTSSVSCKCGLVSLKRFFKGIIKGITFFENFLIVSTT